MEAQIATASMARRGAAARGRTPVGGAAVPVAHWALRPCWHSRGHRHSTTATFDRGGSRAVAVLSFSAFTAATAATTRAARSISHREAAHDQEAAGSQDEWHGAGPEASTRSQIARLVGDIPGEAAGSSDLLQDVLEDEMLAPTLQRVIFPTVMSFILGTVIYAPCCGLLQDMMDIGNTGQGPMLTLLGMDQSQFMQNFLTVNGLLFTILCGNTYTALYNQNERLYHALFLEVSEAKSLLEQASLICQGRPFYPKVLASIGTYVSKDLRRVDADPAKLLAVRPMDDPLEQILYLTSVGVPSIIYETVRDLRQARGVRLGAMQRKTPAVHFLLLYALGLLELLAFPFLGAGTVSMVMEPNILTVQGLFFGAMCGAIVMTLQVIYELWRPFDGAYTVETVLKRMVKGLEEELEARQALCSQDAIMANEEAGTSWMRLEHDAANQQRLGALRQLQDGASSLHAATPEPDGVTVGFGFRAPPPLRASEEKLPN